VGGKTSAYRWHIPDPIVFNTGIKVAFEHFGWISPDENPDQKVRIQNDKEKKEAKKDECGNACESTGSCCQDSAGAKLTALSKAAKNGCETSKATLAKIQKELGTECCDEAATKLATLEKNAAGGCKESAAKLATIKKMMTPATEGKKEEKKVEKKDMKTAKKEDKAKKDEKKKDEPKKDEMKKDEPKKDEMKKDEPKKDEVKKDEPKKDEKKKDEMKKDDEPKK